MRIPQKLQPFVTLERELLAECRVFKVERLRRQSAVSGFTRDYFRLDAGPWVNVVAVTPAEELVLVRQERHGIGDFTLEIPGGLVDPDEDPAASALRELREETGFEAGAVQPLGWVHPNPAIQGNRCYTYLARDVSPCTSGQHLDECEEIEVVTLPMARVRRLVREGQITHAIVLSALYLYDLEREGRGPA